MSEHKSLVRQVAALIKSVLLSLVCNLAKRYRNKADIPFIVLADSEARERERTFSCLILGQSASGQ